MNFKKKYTFKYSVCGLVLSVFLNDQDTYNFIKTKFFNFLDHKKNAKFMTYFKIYPNKNNLKSENCLYDVERQGKIYKFRSKNIQGSIDFENEIAKFNLYGPLNECHYSIIAVLRFITSYYLIKKGYFMLHSSSILLDKCNAVCFCGPSGSGKSTISQLSKKKILSDDMNLLKINNGKVQIFSSPYGGDVIANNIKANLRSIFILFKSSKDKISYCSSMNDFKKLIQEEYFHKCLDFEEQKEFRSYSFLNFYSLTKFFPIYNLYFTKSNKFMKLIKNVKIQ